MVYLDILHWTQGMSMLIDQYTEKFHVLIVKGQIIETDQQIFACYVKGLRGEIKRDMFTTRLFTVDEAC
jgi:hypothetical protein